MPTNTPLRIAVLISGNGSNLQAFIDEFNDNNGIKIAVVISNRPNVYGLERAKRAEITTKTLDHTDYASRENFDQALQQCIDVCRPDLVVLAGFMRILTPEFVRHFKGRLLNIHPSLLPKFRGLHTHQRAIGAGEKEHGTSIHYVTAELDGGPVILQARVPVQKDDTPDTLSARVQVAEHTIYPQVVRWIAEKRLMLKGSTVLMDGESLSKPLDYASIKNTRIKHRRGASNTTASHAQR